jgi:3-isopropylmalate/(R)-2-methylmalate dehydratase small subunit
MTKIQLISGNSIPLIGNDIDTDRIIPARYLRCVTFDGLGQHVFADDRIGLQKQHPFDQPQYQEAKILIVNRNFGCGSSREHAPQAIAKWGINALIGESFAEIFFGNCVAIGIPCLTGTTNDVKRLQEIVTINPQISTTINLETMEVQCSDFTAPVSIGEGARNMFISGTWDACGQLVSQKEQIQATASRLPYMSWA